MLVLTRQQGEGIQIGNDITIRIVRTHSRKYLGRKDIRIGIDAPKDLKIERIGRVNDSKK